MKKILVIGSANADILSFTDKMPKLGQTVEGRDLTIGAGGKGLNQAVAISKLGGDVSFIGAVGDDAYGRMLTDKLSEYKIAFEGCVTEGTSTGIAIVTVVGGDNFIVIINGANGKVTPDMIEAKRELISSADYIVMQLEIPIESVIYAAKTAKEYGKTVILNPAPCKALPDELYSYTDMLIPNEHEAESITGIPCDTEEGVISAIDAIRKKGAQNVIITLGERGCAYNAGEKTVFCPPVKTVAVDTTSAGDSFIGGLVSRLAMGDALDTAIGYATKVASITVSRKGAAVSIPYADEIV